MMLAWDSQYYGDPLRGLRRVTFGDPLSPNILNMVVDAIIQHWVILVAGEEAGPYGFGLDIKWLAMFSMQMMGYCLPRDWPASRQMWAY